MWDVDTSLCLLTTCRLFVIQFVKNLFNINQTAYHLISQFFLEVGTPDYPNL